MRRTSCRSRRRRLKSCSEAFPEPRAPSARRSTVETLTATNEELASSNRLFLSKSKFMDSYVVFVENDGSGLYHKYGCDDFAQTSFWAYSRKLAEANGYTPCPHCFG